jgi:F-type H+-transporting ATPase subunit b
MNSLILLAAAAAPEAAAGNPVAEIAHQFGVTWQLLISQIVLFVIVAVALKKFAFGPLQKVLEERRAKIAEGLAAADKSKTELANAQAKIQEILTQASIQANKIIEEARAAAARITETETQKAVAAAQDIIQKARQANEAELARLRAELRREIGQLAVKAAMQVTGKILTAEDQRRLAEETNQQLAA